MGNPFIAEHPEWVNKTESQIVDERILNKALELKKISAEVTNLQNVREQAQNNLTAVINLCEDANKRVETLKEEIKFLEKIIIESSTETREFIISCIAILRDSASKIESMTQVAKEVEKQAIEATQNLKNVQEEAKTIHEAIVREGKERDRQKNDLDIYHERLKEYFKKYLPDQKIVI